jgi:predicted PurR-regulated permease PerM
MLDDKPYTFDRVFRLAIAAALLVGLVWLLGYLSSVLIPFVVALLLAYMVDPLVRLLERALKKRALAVLAALILVIGFLVLLGWLVIPVVVKEIAHMGRLISDLVSNSGWAQRAAEKLPPDIWLAIKEVLVSPKVREIFTDIGFSKMMETTINHILPSLWGVLSGTATFVWGFMGLSIVVLYFVFLLMDFEKISQNWAEMLPPNLREPVHGFALDFQNAMSSYFRGQALVASLVGVMAAIGFGLVGLPLGVLLGLFVGLLNMVPYLQLIALLPAAMLAVIHSLETGANMLTVFAMTGAVFVVVQIIQDAVLVPKILGKTTGLKPWVILLSLSIWGKLLGLFGLLIALPATFLALAYYRRFVLEKPAAITEEQQGAP